MARLRRDGGGVSAIRGEPLTRSDLVIESSSWSNAVVGKSSEWISLDSSCPATRTAGERAFKQELAWASHLSVPAVMIPTPTKNCCNLSRCLNQALLQATYLQIWVKVPLTSAAKMIGDELKDDDDAAKDGEPEAMEVVAAGAGEGGAAGEGKSDGGDGGGDGDGMGEGVGGGGVGAGMVHLDLQQSSRSSDEAREEAGWLAWNTLRCLCEQNAQLSVCLEITAELPEEVVLQRWLGEPIKSAIINTDVRRPEGRRGREGRAGERESGREPLAGESIH